LKVWSNFLRSFLRSKALFTQRFYHDGEGGSARVQFIGKLFLTDDEVSPLDETALVTAVSIPSNVRLETSRLGPMMTGPTKTEDRRGLKLQRLAFIHRQIAFFHQSISIIHHRDREFPRSPEGART